MGHTPTPPSIGDRVYISDGRFQGLPDVKNAVCAKCGSTSLVIADSDAHDELVAVLRDMLSDRDERGLSDYPSVARARAALAKVQPANGYQRTPQQEQELSIMKSRGEI